MIWMVLFIILASSQVFQGALIYLERAYGTSCRYIFLRRFLSFLGLPSVIIAEIGTTLGRELLFQNLLKNLKEGKGLQSFSTTSTSASEIDVEAIMGAIKEQHREVFPNALFDSGQGFESWLECARDHLSSLLGTNVPELDVDDWKNAFDKGLEPEEAAKNSTQFGDPSGNSGNTEEG